ncbi:MAG: hypothetical protein HS123_23545 [Solibacteraceae bacterium]|nr:hypothetical protein [Solibacteraceae bacterium]
MKLLARDGYGSVAGDGWGVDGDFVFGCLKVKEVFLHFLNGISTDVPGLLILLLVSMTFICVCCFGGVSFVDGDFSDKPLRLSRLPCDFSFSFGWRLPPA